jgi:hypothetical protein
MGCGGIAMWQMNHARALLVVAMCRSEYVMYEDSFEKGSKVVKRCRG